MKKGILVILSLMVFVSVLGLAFVQKDLDVSYYENIIVKNSYGEFEIPVRFFIRWEEKEYLDTGITVRQPEIRLYNNPPFYLIVNPAYVDLTEEKDDHYTFFAKLADAGYGYYLKGKEKIFWVDATGKRIERSLDIYTKLFENKPLEELKKNEWQVLLKIAYDEGLPVAIKARVVDLRYWCNDGPHTIENPNEGYILTIEIDEVEIIKE